MSRVLLAALVIGHFLLTFAYSALNPLGEAPDEADHWAYIVHIARHAALPVGPEMTQAKHPPLYHATAAAIASLAQPTNDFLRANPDVELTPREGWSPNFFIHTARENWPWQNGVLAFHLARLWSVLLSTVTVAAVYALARAALPNLEALALGAAAVVAFLPEFALIGSSASNDVAAAMFGALSLWGAFCMFRNGGRFRPGWWTPLALGLGLLSKVSTVALWPVVALTILLGAAGSHSRVDIANRLPNEPRDDQQPGWPALFRSLSLSWQRWLGTGVLVFVPALLIAAPWLLRNWQLYGDALGMNLVRQTVDLRTTPWTWEDSLWLLWGWFVSFWGKFGGAGHIPMPFWIYAVLAVVTAASALGLVRFFVQRRRPQTVLPVALLLLAVLATALGIWQYSLVALGTDQGRLLFPAIGPLAILLVLGLLAWLPAQHMARGALGVALCSLWLGIYALLGVIMPAFAPPAPLDAAEWEAAALAPAVDFGELTLVGYTLLPEPVLYWRASTTPSQDWRAVLRITGEDGTLVWEWRRSPAAGRWSTDRWPSGAVVADAYQVRWPEWATAGRYRVEVGLQPYDQELVLPQANHQPQTTREHPYLLLGWIERP